MRGLRGICLSAIAIAGSAEAGPWTQLQGDIYARANVSAERLDGEDGWRGDLYGEYGLGGGWMVNGKAESVRYDGGTQDSDAYRISARRQLWSNDKGWAIGAEGAVLYKDGKEIARAAPPKVQVVDTVGAGDTFTAALTVALIEGNSPQDALAFAVTAGALACTRPGAQPSLPHRRDVDALALGGK